MATASTQPSLVIGGGPAGAALATRLAGAGREVVLLEREVGPHRRHVDRAALRRARRYDVPGGRNADAYQRRLARDVSGQVRLVTLLSHGLVRRPAQVALGAAARLWPGLMPSVAFHTRVSDAALSRTMLASHP